jgi:hypothetical protein
MVDILMASHLILSSLLVHIGCVSFSASLLRLAGLPHPWKSPRDIALSSAVKVPCPPQFLRPSLTAIL